MSIEEILNGSITVADLEKMTDEKLFSLLKDNFKYTRPERIEGIAVKTTTTPTPKKEKALSLKDELILMLKQTGIKLP